MQNIPNNEHLIPRPWYLVFPSTALDTGMNFAKGAFIGGGVSYLYNMPQSFVFVSRLPAPFFLSSVARVAKMAVFWGTVGSLLWTKKLYNSRSYTESKPKKLAFYDPKGLGMFVNAPEK
jgi:hypothetical protein